MNIAALFYRYIDIVDNDDSSIQNACMVYKHAVVAAFRIYAQRGEGAAKRGGWHLEAVH